MKRLILLCCFVLTLRAQVPPFNAAGVTMGHHHLIVPDPAVHKKIWVEVLGAQASGNPGLEFLKLPGAFLILSQGNPSGGSEGTSFDHFAFAAREYDATRDKLAAAGVKISNERTQGQKEFVAMFPDGVKVEFYEDKTLATPIYHHHLHFRTTDPDGLRAWYVKAFGAEVKQDGNRTITSIPGAMLSFTRTDTCASGDPRAIPRSHRCQCEERQRILPETRRPGIQCERPAGNTTIAMVTDPAGTRIEINQGLESR